MNYDDYKLDNPYENQSEFDFIEIEGIFENTLITRVFYDNGENYESIITIDDVKMKILLENPQANIADCFFKGSTNNKVLIGLDEMDEKTETITLTKDDIKDEAIAKINV